MRFVAIIPARYASTRFPGKPLALINDKPLIQYVYDAVVNTRIFDDVIVATDEVSIFDKVRSFGGRVMKTLSTHKSGTDRIVEVCRKIACDVVVNVQGDEPFIDKQTLEPILKAFDNDNVSVVSLYHKITDKSLIENPNVVKTVIDKNGYAMYFSRYPIPYNRDGKKDIPHYKHIGVYAYRKDILMKFSRLQPSVYEEIEKLEQLRFLENGIKIKMIETEYNGFGIDTYEDLERAKEFLQYR